jgi:uncharacterized protein (DUF1778 family)
MASRVTPEKNRAPLLIVEVMLSTPATMPATCVGIAAAETLAIYDARGGVVIPVEIGIAVVEAAVHNRRVGWRPDWRHDNVGHQWYSGTEEENAMPNAETRNEKIDLRLTSSAKRTLQIAASAAQRSVSEFVLESALARAAETLPDRQKFGLKAEQWRAFQKALDAAPQPAPRLARLLQEPSVFERGGLE